LELRDKSDKQEKGFAELQVESINIENKFECLKGNLDKEFLRITGCGLKNPMQT